MKSYTYVTFFILRIDGSPNSFINGTSDENENDKIHPMIHRKNSHDSKLIYNITNTDDGCQKILPPTVILNEDSIVDYKYAFFHHDDEDVQKDIDSFVVDNLKPKVLCTNDQCYMVDWILNTITHFIFRRQNNLNEMTKYLKWHVPKHSSDTISVRKSWINTKIIKNLSIVLCFIINKNKIYTEIGYIKSIPFVRNHVFN